MEKRFELIFLEEALIFLRGLDKKHSEKILFNSRKSQTELNPKLFKKLTKDIWEFRTLYQGNQYRLLAFWDKRDSRTSKVIATHGFVKKQSKVKEEDIQKAANLMNKYFSN